SAPPTWSSTPRTPPRAPRRPCASPGACGRGRSVRGVGQGVPESWEGFAFGPTLAGSAPTGRASPGVLRAKSAGPRDPGGAAGGGGGGGERDGGGAGVALGAARFVPAVEVGRAAGRRLGRAAPGGRQPEPRLAADVVLVGPAEPREGLTARRGGGRARGAGGL